MVKAAADFSPEAAMAQDNIDRLRLKFEVSFDLEEAYAFKRAWLLLEALAELFQGDISVSNAVVNGEAVSNVPEF